MPSAAYSGLERRGPCQFPPCATPGPREGFAIYPQRFCVCGKVILGPKMEFNVIVK